jgi:hypothetical protein
VTCGFVMRWAMPQLFSLSYAVNKLSCTFEIASDRRFLLGGRRCPRIRFGGPGH